VVLTSALVSNFFLAFLIFWRWLFLGVARFGCFGFACCSSILLYNEAGLRRGYLGEMQVGGNRMFPLKFVALEFGIYV